MKKIIEYKIAYGQGYGSLTEHVNQLMEKGFQPYGSMAANEYGIYQPMVKYEEDEQPTPTIK